MARSLRVLRLHRRRGVLSRGAAAAVFTLAWVLELWLLVIGCALGVLALVRAQRHYRRTFLPAVVAGTAVARPPGAMPVLFFEEWVAVWLAAISGGRRLWLRQAARLVAATEEDRWRAHVATTRLEAADMALAEGRILGLSSRRRLLSPRWRVVLWGTGAAALLLVSQGGTAWWLLPICVALAGTTSSLTELEESRAAPRILAAEALTSRGGWHDREVSPLELALLAGGDNSVVVRARRLVEAANWRLPHREGALRQLRAAEALTRRTEHDFVLVSDGGLHWWIMQGPSGPGRSRSGQGEPDR